MKNDQRQVRKVVKYPPIKGPIMPAAPATAPHMPKATLRAFPVNVVDRIERVEGEAIAPPNPWIDRPTSICESLAESPSIIDPNTNIATPAIRLRFLPNSSPSFPHVKRKAPKMRP